MTDRQAELINKLFTERYFTRQDVSRLSESVSYSSGNHHRRYFINLNRLENLSDTMAEKLIHALEQAPLGSEAEEKEDNDIKRLLRRKQLLERVKDHGMKAHSRVKTEDIFKAIYATGLTVPEEFLGN
jgi:hypothetical protein